MGVFNIGRRGLHTVMQEFLQQQQFEVLEAVMLGPGDESLAICGLGKKGLGKRG